MIPESFPVGLLLERLPHRINLDYLQDVLKRYFCPIVPEIGTFSFVTTSSTRLATFQVGSLASAEAVIAALDGLRISSSNIKIRLDDLVSSSGPDKYRPSDRWEKIETSPSSHDARSPSRDGLRRISHSSIATREVDSGAASKRPTRPKRPRTSSPEPLRPTSSRSRDDVEPPPFADPTKLYLGNLPLSFTTRDVHELFAPSAGSLLELRLCHAALARFAFVTVRHPSDAPLAIAALNNKIIDGHQLLLQYYRDTRNSTLLYPAEPKVYLANLHSGTSEAQLRAHIDRVLQTTRRRDDSPHETREQIRVLGVRLSRERGGGPSRHRVAASDGVQRAYHLRFGPHGDEGTDKEHVFV